MDTRSYPITRKKTRLYECITEGYTNVFTEGYTNVLQKVIRMYLPKVIRMYLPKVLRITYGEFVYQRHGHHHQQVPVNVLDTLDFLLLHPQGHG